MEQQNLDFEGQEENLERVSARIAEAIMDFCKQRSAEPFYVEDLRRYVEYNIGHVAPGSPDRILRNLRKKKKLDYRVLSRRESLYQVIP